MITEIRYAALAPGSERSWLRLLAQGWRFGNPLIAEPMMGVHGQWSVLMVREVRV